jgi:hypothetical protein
MPPHRPEPIGTWAPGAADADRIGSRCAHGRCTRHRAGHGGDGSGGDVPLRVQTRVEVW